MYVYKLECGKSNNSISWRKQYWQDGIFCQLMVVGTKSMPMRISNLGKNLGFSL